MPIPVRPRFPSPDPNWLIEITDDGSRTLVRIDSDLSFHSHCGAAAECDHVYLHNGGCSLEAISDPEQLCPSTILEIGFGTGLSMLRTLDWAMRYERPMHYISVERSPLRVEILHELKLDHGLHQPALAERFLTWYASCKPSDHAHTFHWEVTDQHRVELVIDDAQDWIERTDIIADTIYFDPFDPSTNGELWDSVFLKQLAKRLRVGGRLVTYCVASEIRRRVEAAGFEVQRVPGPTGGKREVMIATK
jgi:tRNA U34 5-methylaminomethyl-2-thiouridine-forming methyltransferase MnmC